MTWPTVIRTDGGTDFRGNLERIARLLMVRMTRGVPGKHNSMARHERANRTINDGIRCLLHQTLLNDDPILVPMYIPCPQGEAFILAKVDTGARFVHIDEAVFDELGGIRHVHEPVLNAFAADGRTVWPGEKGQLHVKIPGLGSMTLSVVILPNLKSKSL